MQKFYIFSFLKELSGQSVQDFVNFLQEGCKKRSDSVTPLCFFRREYLLHPPAPKIFSNDR